MTEENKNEEADTQTGALETTPGSRLTALQDPKKHPLARTLKSLDKTTEEALSYLAEVMRDKEIPSKERVAAAQFLIDRKIQVAQEINRDSLSRIIAESRMLIAESATRKEKTVGEDEEGGSPRVSFDPTTILKVPMDISNIKSL